jgi:outer membrane cobalamin receptor
VRLLLLTLFLAALAAVPARAQTDSTPATSGRPGELSSQQDQTDEASAESEEEIDLGVVNVEGEALPQEEGEQPEPVEQEGEAVEVQQPAPATAQVIEREQLDAQALDTVDRVLEREAGFVVQDTFAGSSVSYHGLPGKFSTVTIDGQRLPGHIFEQVDFGQLPLGSIERIEIVRGPQAAAYGPDSAGIIVNLVPRTPDGEGGEARLGIGSLGYNRQHLLLYDGNKRRDWNFSAERELREAYDFNSLFPDTDGDSYRNYSVAGAYNERFGSNELRLRAEYFDENSNGLGFSPPNLTRILDTDTRRWQATGSYRWQLGECSALTLSQNYGVYNHDLERYFEAFPATRQETGFTDTLWDSRLGWEHEGHVSWKAGVERSFDKLVSDRITGAEAQQTNYGGYVTASWPSGDWTLDAAVRMDAPEGFDATATPKLGATLKLNEHETLALGAGQGYRAPSLRERHYEFASPFGYTVFGNPNLEPEKSTSYTIDWLRETEDTKLAIGAFEHAVENLITFSQTQAVPQVFTTENVGRARSTGFDLSAEQRWLVGGCRCCGGDYFGLGLDGTWLARAKDGELDTRLANAPELDSSLRAFYATPDLRAEAQWRSVGARFLDRENLNRAPAYSTLDLTLSRQAGKGTWRLAGLNVLDEKDGRFGPEPGREIRAEYTLKW